MIEKCFLFFDYLQIESAIESCSSYLQQTLEDTNCFSLLKLAETFGLDRLYNVSKRHSLYYFNKVVKHAEFQNLNQLELINYLAEKHLNVESELNVLDAIDSWVNSNSTNERLADLAAILECFHPEDLMEGEWEIAIEKKILTETEAGKQWLDSHTKPGTTTGEQVHTPGDITLISVGPHSDYFCYMSMHFTLFITQIG